MFYITISNGLLKDGHPKRMGAAVWEFMWCLDKTTMIDAKGIGWVLGKKPIKLEDIAKDLGVHEVTISRNLGTLEELGYIQKINAPYGIIIGVNKAKKRFNKKVEPQNENAKPPNENAKPNKTVSKDSNQKTEPSSAQSADWRPEDLSQYLESMRQNKNRAIQVIYHYLAYKGVGTTEGKIQLRNKAQAQHEISRHLRIANRLRVYTDDQLEKTMEILSEHARFDWNLDTVGKYVNYDKRQLVDNLIKIK